MAVIKNYCLDIFCRAIKSAWTIVGIVSGILSPFGGYLGYKHPAWGPTMTNALWIIPLCGFPILTFIGFFVAGYIRDKEQQNDLKEKDEFCKKEISNLNKKLKIIKYDKIQANTEGEYSSELLDIKEKLDILLSFDANRFGKLLFEKAANYHVRRTFWNHNIANNWKKYFASPTEYINYMNSFSGSYHGMQGLFDIDLGKYCYVLFLIYDNHSSNMQYRNEIVGTASSIIIDKFMADSPLAIYIYNQKFQFEEIVKDCTNPPKNNTEIIGHLREYLNSIYVYLESEGYFKGNTV